MTYCHICKTISLVCLASTHAPIPDDPVPSVPASTSTSSATSVVPAGITREQWYGWIKPEPVIGDPTSVIHVDGRYPITSTPYWPVGYVTPKIKVMVGKGDAERARVPKNKRLTRRKGHQHQRECERFRRAHWVDPITFPHPVKIGERHQIFKVPTPTTADFEMWNKRMLNGVLWTYMKIDEDYKGVVMTTDEITEEQLNHAVLSNFRTVKDEGNKTYISPV